jgi:hypothetical protein
MPAKIDDPSAVLFAYKHAELLKKTENGAAVLSGDFWGPSSVVSATCAVVVLLLVLRDSCSAVPDGVFHRRRASAFSSSFNNRTRALDAATLAMSRIGNFKMGLHQNLMDVDEKFAGFGG